MAEENKNNSFEVHFNKLNLFSKELQEDKVSIDDLVERMKDALESVKICKSVLKETKSQIIKVSKEFEKEI